MTGVVFSGNQQFGRSVSLLVGVSGGKALDLSALRITFAVQKGAIQTPNPAEIRIYNPADATVARVQREFTDVQLSAGYAANPGIIFRGKVMQTQFQRESPTDTFLVIWAQDGDKALNFGQVNETLAAGWTQQQQMQRLIQTYRAYDGIAGPVQLDPPASDIFSQAPMPRGRVLVGDTRDHCRVAARTTDSAFSIQDGAAQFVGRNQTLTNTAIVLSPDTGLIGLPQQTQDGIMARCLLNPLLKVNGLVKLTTGSTSGPGLIQAPNSYDATAAGQAIYGSNAAGAVTPNRLTPLASDGLYKVLYLTQHGDTRGNDYYSDLTLVAANGDSGPSAKLAGLGVG